MNNKNISSSKKAQAEIDRELKRDVIADRQINNTTDYCWITALMNKIERMRQERLNISSIYTQKMLAKNAGIGLSTYKDYLSGLSDNIKLKTVINIAHVLRCKPSDLIDDIGEEH